MIVGTEIKFKIQPNADVMSEYFAGFIYITKI